MCVMRSPALSCANSFAHTFSVVAHARNFELLAASATVVDQRAFA